MTHPFRIIIVCLGLLTTTGFIVNEAVAKPAPPIYSVAQVPAAWLAEFKRGYLKTSEGTLICRAGEKTRICYDEINGVWVFLFRPTRCILEVRLARDTNNVTRDFRTLDRNPFFRKRVNSC